MPPRQLTRRAFLALGAIALGAVGGLAGIAGAASNRDHPADQRISLGDLTLIARADPWRLSLLGPQGETLWDEADDEPLGYRTVDGQSYRARRLVSVSLISLDAVHLVAETDDPLGGAISVEVRAVAPRVLRMSVIPDAASRIASVV